MKRYRDWSPTGFDARGLGLEDRQDWFVAPVCRTRDSAALDESNFRSVLRELGGESDTVEVHRFGHWGPGWFEIILCAPEHESALEEIEGALSEYPVFSDDDLSEAEQDEQSDSWESWVRSEFESGIEKACDCELDWTDDDAFALFRTLCDRSNTYWEHSAEGASIDVGCVVDACTWKDVQDYATPNEPVAELDRPDAGRYDE